MAEPIFTSVSSISFFFGDVPSRVPFGLVVLCYFLIMVEHVFPVCCEGVLSDVNVLIPYILHPHTRQFLGQKSFALQNLEVPVFWLPIEKSMSFRFLMLPVTFLTFWQLLGFSVYSSVLKFHNMCLILYAGCQVGFSNQETYVFHFWEILLYYFIDFFHFVFAALSFQNFYYLNI